MCAWLQPVLADIGQCLDAAVLLDVEMDILLQRLTGRRTCSKTGKLLNIYFSPKEELDECVNNGGELIQRADDNEETIANRLNIYREQTEPLIGFYQEAGVLKTVVGEGDIEAIYTQLKIALGLS